MIPTILSFCPWSTSSTRSIFQPISQNPIHENPT